MTETLDQLIQARFDAVADAIDNGDWTDVLARAVPENPIGPTRQAPKSVLLLAAATVGAAVVSAVALGLPQTIIDFFSSPPAPTHVKNWFGALSVGAPRGMDPHAIPGQARKIATAKFDVGHLHGGRPTVHTLYVAPKKGGGFCYLWTNADGGCLPAKPPSKTAAMRAIGPLGISWFSAGGPDYPLLVDGWVRSGAAKTLEARFVDGTTAPIAVTWVSAPVNAGFLVYPVPAAHRTRSDALQSVVALDASGKVIGRESFPLTKLIDEDIPQTLPDGTKVSLPRRAEAAKARKIISFRATDHSEVYLWVMPRTGGGDCFVATQTSGCRIPRFEAHEPAFNGGFLGGAHRILFFGQAKPAVAAVELRYQSGERERLTPVDGFVLTEITPSHYKRGMRLASAVAFDRSGKAISTERFQPQESGVYPCKKPVSKGYGVKTCP